MNGAFLLLLTNNFLVAIGINPATEKCRALQDYNAQGIGYHSPVYRSMST